MIKIKVTFWVAGFYPANQSNQKFSKCPDWLEKSRPSKKSHFCFGHVNRLIQYLTFRGFFRMLCDCC